MEENSPFTTADHGPLRAHIAWVCPRGDAPGAPLSDAFAEAGFAVDAARPDPARPQTADAAIVDFRGARVHLKKARRLASIARWSAPQNTIIYLCDPTISAEERAYLRRSGAVITDTPSPEPLITLCRRAIRHRNICEEAGERFKSLNLAAQAAPLSAPRSTSPATPPKEQEARAGAVLICSKPSPLSLRVMTVLRGAGYAVEAVLSPSQAVAALKAQHGAGGRCKFAAAVMVPSAPSDPIHALAERLSRTSARAGLPVMTICDDPDTVDFLREDHVEDDLAALLAQRIETAAARCAMERFLTPAGHNGAADAHANAYSASFFAGHGARLLSRALETGRPLSFAAFSIEAPAFAGGDVRDSAATLREVSAIVSRVTRAEDSLYRLSAQTFALALPATTGADAKRVAGRIEGVLQSTRFKRQNAIEAAEALFSIDIAASVWSTDAHPGDAAGRPLEEIIAALLTDLRAQRRITRRPPHRGARP